MLTQPDTSCFDVPALTEFYARLSSDEGIEIRDFQAAFAELFQRTRPAAEVDRYRLSQSDWKKLADEVSPVSLFLKFRHLKSGRIRFPLNSEAPDCWFWREGESARLGIEVTIALGTARYHLKKELVEKGIAPGFLALSDDAPREAFDNAVARGRIMHSTDGILSTTKEGILRCLQRKNRPHFAGFTLVIQAPLGALPSERWNAIVGALQAEAAPLPFTEIYVIGDREGGSSGFRIK